MRYTLALLLFASGYACAVVPGCASPNAATPPVRAHIPPGTPDWLRAPRPDSITGNGLFVNVNTATQDELQGLPHIGPGRAAAIIRERDRAPFGSFLELNRLDLSCHDLVEIAPFATFAGDTDPFAR